MKKIILDSVEFATIKVNDVKSWSFAVFTDANGTQAVIEAQGLPGQGRDRTIEGMVSALKDVEIEDESQVETLLGHHPEELLFNMDLACPVGALRTAVTELQCRYEGKSMTEWLGGKRAEKMQLYANINRYLAHVLKKRSPKDFAQAAERAARDGFRVLKCDPFDEIRTAFTVSRVSESMGLSLERLREMRDAVGKDVDIQVDCHGSFNIQTAPFIASELEKLNISWFEDPVSQSNRQAEILGALSESVNLPLVAGGSGYGESYFRELVETGKVKIIMPDVMRCGGVGVAARAGQEAIEKGVLTSCHSPFGPLSLLASAHVQASIRESHPLEYAVYEADWRSELAVPPETVKEGFLFFPDGNGLGASLDWDLVSRYGSRWHI